MGMYVRIIDDSNYRGVIGEVLSIMYVTVDGEKKPFKARVRVKGEATVKRSGFMPGYIKYHNLAVEGIVLLKDWDHLEMI